jgi:hypothetical protein
MAWLVKRWLCLTAASDALYLVGAPKTRLVAAARNAVKVNNTHLLVQIFSHGGTPGMGAGGV